MRRIILGLALVAGCVAPTISTRQRIGALSIDGDVGVSTTGGGATSSADGLGFERDDEVFQPRFDIDWAGTHLALNVFQSRHAGNGIAESDLNLVPGGDTIFAGDLVRSDLDLMLSTLALTFDVVPTDFVDVGIGIGLGAFEYDAFLEAPLTGSVISSDETFPIGFVATRGVVRLGKLAFEADVNVLEYSYDDDDLRYLDLDLALAYRFFVQVGFAEAVIGYRLLSTDLSYDDGDGEVDADLDYDGVYLGFTVGL